jgi:hypothetical protein
VERTDKLSNFDFLEDFSKVISFVEKFEEDDS